MPVSWEPSGGYEDILYATAEGIAKITINRPEVRNAFRPTTLFELADAFERARNDPAVGVIILTGAGDQAFCSGGDQRIRGDAGYVDPRGTPRLNVLDLQIQMRRLPKPIIAMVAGYAIGGGHVLHLVCDLTIAADNAVFGQTGPKVGSFDGGYGAGLLARMVGDKRAREIWFLCRQYSAQEAFEMGMVNKVVPLADLEEETVAWAREILDKGAGKIGAELGDQPAIQARLMDTIGTVYTGLGLYDRAESILEQSLKIKRSLYGEDDLGLADTLQSIGIVVDNQDLTGSDG